MICVLRHVTAKCAPFRTTHLARAHLNPLLTTYLIRFRRQSVNRKPDLLWILVILFGLGIVTTGYAQSLWTNKPDAPLEIVQQQQKVPGRH